MPQNDYFKKAYNIASEGGLEVSPGVFFNNLHNAKYFDKFYTIATEGGLTISKEEFKNRLGIGNEVKYMYEKDGTKVTPEQYFNKRQAPTQPQQTPQAPQFKDPMESALDLFRSSQVKPKFNPIQQPTPQTQTKTQQGEKGAFRLPTEQELQTFTKTVPDKSSKVLPQGDIIEPVTLANVRSKIDEQLSKGVKDPLANITQYQKEQANNNVQDKYNLEQEGFSKQIQDIQDIDTYSSILEQQLNNQAMGWDNNGGDFMTMFQSSQENLNKNIQTFTAFQTEKQKELEAVNNKFQQASDQYQNGTIDQYQYNAALEEAKASQKNILQEVETKKQQVQAIANEHNKKYSSADIQRLQGLYQLKNDLLVKRYQAIDNPEYADLKAKYSKWDVEQSKADESDKIRQKYLNGELSQEEIKKYTEDGTLQNRNAQAWFARTVGKLTSDILTLPRTFTPNDSYGWTDRLADWANRLNQDITMSNPYSSNLQQSNFQKIAVDPTGQYKVILDDDGEIKSVRLKDGYNAPSFVQEQIKKQYEADKSKFSTPKTEFNEDVLMKNAVNTMTDMGILILGSKGASLALKLGSLGQKLTTGAAIFGQVHNDIYNGAIKQKLNPSKASQLAILTGSGLAMVSYVNPLEYNLASNATRNMVTQADVALINSGKLSVSELSKQYVKGIAKNIVGENLEEVVLEPILTDVLAGSYGMESNEFDPISKEGLETMLITSLVSLPMGVAEVNQELPDYKIQSYKLGAENLIVYNNIMQDKLNKGIITQEEFDTQTEQFAKFAQRYNYTKGQVKENQRDKLVELLVDKSTLENNISTIGDKSLTINEQERLKEVDNELAQLLQQPKVEEQPISEQKEEQPIEPIQQSTPRPKKEEFARKLRERLEREKAKDVKVESAVIEIGGKIYEGKNHAEAILKAKEDGQDISNVNRQEQGKFKLSDGTIIDRSEAKQRFGQDRSELMIEQDKASEQANKDYKKITEASDKVETDIVGKKFKYNNAEWEVLEDRGDKVMVSNGSAKIIVKKDDVLANINPVEKVEQPTSTTQSDIEAKKADIERRRQEDLNKLLGESGSTQEFWSTAFKYNTYEEFKQAVISKFGDSQNVLLQLGPRYKIAKDKLEPQYNKINAKYDAELKALEQSTSTNQSESNPALRDVESTAKALEGVQRENVDKFVNDFANIDIPFRQENIQAEMDSAVKKQLFPNEKTRRKYAETIYSAVVRSSNFPKILSEAYHKAKADGSNPELVKAVEDLIAPKVAPTTNTEGETQTTEAQLQEFGVPEQDIKPVTNVLTAMVDGLRKAGLTAAKTVGEFVGIGKGKKTDSSLKQIIGERGAEGSFEEKYGVTFEQVEKLFESDYKNIYSGLERTFEELGVQQENLGNAIGDFMAEKVSRDLPSKLPNKKEKWDKDDLPRDRSLNVKPIPTKVKKVDLKTQQGKIEALKPITSKDDLRPNMQGVFHDADKKVLVATDAHKMVVIKDPTIKKTFIQDVTGKVVGLGKEIDAKYPDYSVVIPESAPIKQKVNVQQMLDETAGLARASDFFVDKDHLGIAAKITIGDKEFFFNPRLFNEVLTVFAQQGDKEVELQLSKPNRALKIESGDVTAILMPVQGYDQTLDNSVPHKEIFRRDETVDEKRKAIQNEIEYLEKNIKEAEGKLKLANDAFRKADASNYKSLEWDKNYEQRKYEEAKAALEEKKSELLGISNPIQEQSDKEIIKKAINNGEITEQEASNFIESANTDEVESVIEAIESKAESETEVELNEVVEEVDDAVKGKVKPKPKKTGISANAQYRVESGKRLIEALKDFSKAKNKRQATTAIIHEIMHPTVETIITGAKEGNAVGQKHTKTIVDEYNKANPDNKVTEEELIADNDKFVNGETTDKYRAVQEFIAEQWERYHQEGAKGFSKAFQEVLDAISEAFKSVYNSLVGKELTPELRKMFDELLGKESLLSKEQTLQVEKVGSGVGGDALKDVESTAKADYLVDSIFIEKINHDGENTPLTERQQGSIDKAIQMAIDAGQTAEQIAATLNALGYAFRNPLGMRAAQQTLINYIKNRIKGTDTRNVNEFAKNTKAVESLLSNEQSTSTTQTESKVVGKETTENPALRDVESTAKALKELDEKELDAVPNWVSKETQETETKKVTIKDGQEITLKYLYDNNIEGKVAYILGFNSNGEQISTVMIEQGKDGSWKGNDLEVDEPYRRKGLATAMYDYADEQGHNLTPTKSLQPDGVKFWGKRNKDRAKSISVAYHKAKAKSETARTEQEQELVKAVESLLSKEQTPPALRDVESTAKALEGVDNDKIVEAFGKKVIHHGTGIDFSVLDENKQNSATGHGDFGKGFYFSIDKGIARYYSLKFDKAVRRVKSFLHSIARPFEINITNEIFDSNTQSALKKLKGLQYYEKEIILNNLDKEFGYKKITKEIGDSRFSDILETNGFDAVWVNRTLGGETKIGAEIVVFNKKNVTELTNKSISEAYHKAKAKSETARTEQEQELVKAVEELLSKEQGGQVVDVANKIKELEIERDSKLAELKYENISEADKTELDKQISEKQIRQKELDKKVTDAEKQVDETISNLEKASKEHNDLADQILVDEPLTSQEEDIANNEKSNSETIQQYVKKSFRQYLKGLYNGGLVDFFRRVKDKLRKALLVVNVSAIMIAHTTGNFSFNQYVALAQNYSERHLEVKPDDSLQTVTLKVSDNKLEDNLGVNKIPYKSGYATNQIINLEGNTFEARNRADVTPVQNAVGITTNLFKPFQEVANFKGVLPRASDSVRQNPPVIAFNKKTGNVKAGNLKDFNSDWLVSETFTIPLDFKTDINGKIKTVYHGQAQRNVPISTANGKEIPFPIGLDTKDKTIDPAKHNTFGVLEGGKVILSVGTYQVQVNGGFADIYNAWKELKSKNPNKEITAYLLDNGSYNLPILKDDGVVTSEDLTKQTLRNKDGGTSLVLKQKVPQEAANYPHGYQKVETDNFRKDSVGNKVENKPTAIVLHHTGEYKGGEKDVIKEFTAPKGNSAHYLIGKDGKIYQFNDGSYVMFHAGESLFKGKEDLNSSSIGIEIQGDSENSGDFTKQQYESIVLLVYQLAKNYNIPIENIVDHKTIRDNYLKSHPENKTTQKKVDLNDMVMKHIVKELQKAYPKIEQQQMEQHDTTTEKGKSEMPISTLLEVLGALQGLDLAIRAYRRRKSNKASENKIEPEQPETTESTKKLINNPAKEVALSKIEDLQKLLTNQKQALEDLRKDKSVNQSDIDNFQKQIDELTIKSKEVLSKNNANESKRSKIKQEYQDKIEKAKSESLLSKEQPTSTTKTESKVVGKETTENPALASVEATAKALEGEDVSEIKNIIITPIETLEERINDKVYKDPIKTSRWRIKDNNFTYSSKKEASNVVENKYKRDVFAREQEINKINNQSISQAYHKAKADGSNPELVKAVEELLAPKEEVTKEEKPKFQTTDKGKFTKLGKETFDKFAKRLKAVFPKIKLNTFTDWKEALGVSQEQLDLMFQVEAWHGSPHDIKDGFKTDKIGTGEGNQAFGWGLYFTELESIARAYAKALTIQIPSFNGKTINVLSLEKKFGKNKISQRTLDLLQRALNSVDGVATKEDLIKYVNENTLVIDKERNESLSLIEGYNDGQNTRKVYKVTLHKGKSPSEYTWLEWNKPLTSKQKEQILNQLEKEGKKDSFTYKKIKSVTNDSDGGEIYNVISEMFEADLSGFARKHMNDSAKRASLFLLRAGIDGIKYPAESIARGTTSDNARGFNYVVFDENAITIEEKIQFLRTPNGTVYGFVKDGQVFINENELNANTLVHEYGHIFAQILKAQYPTAHKNLIDRIKQEKALIEAKKKDPNYANLTTEQLADEVLNELIGNKGETILNTKKPIHKEILDLLNRFWNRLKNIFTTGSPNIAKWSVEQFQNATIDDIVNNVTADLLSGRKLSNVSSDMLGGKTTFQQQAGITKDEAIKRNNGNPLNLAPNGKPSKLYQSYKDLGYSDSETERLTAQVYSDNFKNWFGDWQNDPKNASKVVDENGMPLIVYHGTNANFTEFKITKDKKGNQIPFGVHFTKDKGVANDFSNDSNNIMPSFLNIRKYIDITKEETVLDGSFEEGTFEFDVLNTIRKNSKLSDYILKKQDGKTIIYASDVLNSANYKNILTQFKKNKIDGVKYSAFYKTKTTFQPNFDKFDTSFVAINSNQIKSATDNIGTFDSGSNDIRYQKDTYLELIEGFYSPLEKIINETKFEKLPAKQWIDKFAKGEEAKWTGLTEWLNQQQGSVSKADIQKYLKDNRIQVVEVVKGGFDDGDIAAWWNDEGGANEETPFDELSNSEKRKARERYADEVGDWGGTETKFSQYQLEGEKENYKEIVIVLPREGQMAKVGDYKVPSVHKYNEDLADNRRLVHLRMNTRTDVDGNKVLFLEEIQSDWGQTGKKEGFKDDELERKRTAEIKEEISKNKTKIISIEQEIIKSAISEYNNNGNPIGSGNPIELFKDVDYIKKAVKYLPFPKTENLVNERNSLLITNEVLKDKLSGKYGGVYKMSDKNQDKLISVAPFITDTNAWTKLGLKVALKEAVKQGADKIAWTTGEQQNDRYDLSKEIDNIYVEKGVEGSRKGKYYVEAHAKGSGETPISGWYEPNQLEGIVGKELAEKIVQVDNNKTFSGVDLKAGGKGMKGFYGSPTEGKLGIVGEVAKSLFKQVPKTVDIFQSDKLASGWSVTVKDKQGYVSTQMFDSKSKGLAWLSEQEGLEVLSSDAEGKNYSTQHSIDITPELRASVESGLPLFMKNNTDQKAFETNDKTPATKQNIQDKFKDAIVVQKESELPQSIQSEIKRQRAEGKVKGVFYDGQIYMVADNIQTLGEATGTYRHETLGHKGVIAYLGTKLDKYAISLVNNATLAQLAKLKQLARSYGLGTDLSKLTDKQKSDLGQEYIAFISENKGKYPSAWRKIVDFVRQTLRSFGVKLSVSDAEIESLIGKVERAYEDYVKERDRLTEEWRSATENIGTFDSGSNDIRFQIIGEVGAENLPKVRENLQVARDMEKEGKTPKEIYLATGWERTKDNGKWKYDLPDLEFKDLNETWIKNRIQNFEQFLVGSLFDNKTFGNVFDAYKQRLYNIPVTIGVVRIKGGDWNGTYLKENEKGIGRIDVRVPEGTDIFSKESQEKIKSILLHEIQHAIQDIEGFARGGNVDTYKDHSHKEILKNIGVLSESERIIIKNEIDRIEEDFERVRKTVKYKSLLNLGEEKALEYAYGLGGRDRINKHKLLKDKLKNAEITPFEFYKRLAGEVEARNVQKRATMTAEERRQQMLSETEAEDVAEESKIYIYEADKQLSLEKTQYDYNNPLHNDLNELLNDYISITEEGETSLEDLKDTVGEDLYNTLLSELGENFILSKISPPSIETFEQGVKDAKTSKEKKDLSLVKRGDLTFGEDAKQLFDEMGRKYTPDKWKEIEPKVDEYVQKLLASPNFDEDVENIIKYISDTSTTELTESKGLATAQTMLLNKIAFHAYQMGKKELFKKVFKFSAERGKVFGQAIAAYAEASTPESLLNQAVAIFEGENDQVLNTIQPSGKTMLEELEDVLSKISITAEQVEQVLKQTEAKRKGVTQRARKPRTQPTQTTDKPVSTKQREKANDKIKDAKARLSDWFKENMNIGFAYNPKEEAEKTLKLVSILKDLAIGYLQLGTSNITYIKEQIQKSLGDKIKIDDVWSQVYDDEVSQLHKQNQKDAIINNIVSQFKDGKTSSTKDVSSIIARSLALQAKKISGKKSTQTDMAQRVKELLENKDLARQAWEEALSKAKEEINAKNIPLQEKIDLIHKIEDAIGNFIAIPQSISRKAIRKGMKDVDTTIDDLIKSHFTQKEAKMNDIVKAIVDNTGLSLQESIEYYDILYKEFNDMLSEKQTKQLEKTLYPKEITRKQKNEVQKMVEAINMGALGTDSFIQAFGEKFGLKKLTEEQVANIKKFTDLMYSTDGEMRRRLAKELSDYIDSLKPMDARNIGRLLNNIVIHHALSGISTIAENIPIGSTLSTITNLLPVIIMNPIRTVRFLGAYNKAGLSGTGTKALADTLRSGYNDMDFFLTEDDMLKKGSRYYNFINKLGFDNPKDFLASVLYKIPMHFAYMASAFDNIINHRGGELLNFIDEYKLASKEVGDVYTKVLERMGYDKASTYSEQVDEEIEDIKALGMKVPIGYKERRVKELMVAGRNKELQQQAYETIKTYGLMGQPDSILGFIYNHSLKKWGNIKDTDNNLMVAIKTILNITLGMFTRITVAGIEMSLKSTPIFGLMMSAYKYDSKTDKFRATTWEEKKRALAMQAMITGTLIAILAEMFDYDDDELKLNPNRRIDITGSKIPFFDRETLQGEDGFVEPLSFGYRKKDGTMKYVSFAKYIPVFVPLLAFVGNMRDKLEVRDTKQLGKEEFNTNSIKVDASLLLSLITDTFSAQNVASYNTIGSFLTDMVKAQSYHNDNPDIQAEKRREKVNKVLFKTFVSRPGKTLLMPNLYKSVVQLTEYGTDATETMDGVYKNSIKEFYGLDHLVNHEQLDMFGNEVKQPFPIFGLDNEDRYELPEWKMLVDKNITFESPYIGEKATFKGEKVEVSQKDRLILNDKLSIIFGNLVRENIDELKEMNQMKLLQTLKAYANASEKQLKAMPYKEALKLDVKVER